MTSLWRAAFLAEHYGRLTLTLDEVAEQIGLAAGTILERRATEFQWLEGEGAEIAADAFLVAMYLEMRRHRPTPRDLHFERALIVGNRWYRRIAKRIPPWADKAKIRAVYMESRRLTLVTGIRHHVDHEIPLRGVNVSGLHVETNLRAIPAADNVAKSNRFVP